LISPFAAAVESGGASCFRNAVVGQFGAVNIVDDAVDDGIGDRVIGDDPVQRGSRNLQ